MRILALILTLVAAPSLAADLMTADEFDTYTKGKTFTYGFQGAPYGIEQYLDNRRVRWSFAEGTCQEGEWYEEDGLICFVYETEPEPQCWSFRKGNGGLVAKFENDPSALELYEVGRSPTPLICPGPDVGV
ncbi:hypothetical protein ACEWPM_007725 [Roseovarius sp. S4756]|uniref:hypothetical protein n=1 Tax=Roseovarius maritimus TaxID=3342637 RepID=UPI0037280BEF